MHSSPKVGVGLIIKKANKALFGRRKTAHGKGSWQLCGGHLNFNETAETCARREAFEEAGIKIKNIKHLTFTEDIFKKEGKHYITLFLVADYASGKVRNMEPHKLEEWKWFEWSKLPKPLFRPIQNLLKKGHNPFK